LGSNRYGAYVSLLNSLSTLPFFYNPVNSKKWQAGRESNSDLRLRTAPCSSVTPPAHGTRAGNPTRISSLGPKRHHALDHASTNWKGCRELNSDLKVRSLAPSIRWTTPPLVGRRCRTRTDIQSLEGSVLIQLNEAPSRIKSGAGCRNRTCFVSLKRRVHSRICQSRKLWWVTLESNQRGLA
jgi:hypothetical protein